MELVGERWSLMILRELMFGPRRFSDIRAALPGISANVLTQRLDTLEAHGVVERSRLPPPASVQVYGLTPWGYEADEMIMALGRWAARSPDHDPTLPLSPASLMLSFLTMFDAAKADGDGGRFGFRLGEETFVVTVAEGRLSAERATIEDVDVTFVGRPEPIAGFVYVKAPLEALDGALALEGDVARARAFQSWFNLPEKAPKPQPPE
ncbi:MAG: winged helix-turn-helix transcriptional regulator [Brevundimonas sp.]